MAASREIVQRVEEAFTAFVADERFPCLAAKGVLRRGDHRLRVYGRLGSRTSSAAVARDLAAFVPEKLDGDRFTAFVAVFEGRAPATEQGFERGLWTTLQRLHDRDDPNGVWDPEVSSDPENPDFSFSFAGRAFFVVGLHPRSSRLARQFRWPALVFNPRAQFQQLRDRGLFDPLRDAIRARDVALQGSVNPTLTDFGMRSEARQYSGRDTTNEEWRCPFRRRRF
jgi:FPC/CPF motif-containing protein YcgG